MFIRTLLIMQNDNDRNLFHDCLEMMHALNISVKDIIISLQDLGYILKSYSIPKKGNEFDPYSIPVNKQFTNRLYKSSFEMGKELFDNYPQFANINGCYVGIRSISRKFDSLEDAYFKYAKTIRFSPSKHKRIIELVNWAKDKGLINYSLSSFIVDQRWNDLETLEQGNGEINYDTVRMI